MILLASNPGGRGAGPTSRMDRRSAKSGVPTTAPSAATRQLADLTAALGDDGHIPDGVWARVCQRVLALAAGVWHSWQLWDAGLIDAPGRHFINPCPTAPATVVSIV
jgi:hypothetical protein